MKKIISLIFLFLVACGPGPQELFETAEFEVVQTNYPHAIKLYNEIIEKHPDSDYAVMARERITEIHKKTEFLGVQETE